MTVRQHLRERTRPAHERTDDAFSMLDLSKRDDYRLFLASHFLAYSALEPVFAAKLPEGARPPPMATLLADDLRALGATVPVAMADAFKGDALGAAYVVAGSNFGKRVLLKRWSRSDDPVVASAGKYLGSSALSDYWPVLNAVIEDSDDTESVSQGADATFRLFARCLSQMQSA